MGTSDQIVQVGKLTVKRYQSLIQVSFPLIDPGLGYWYIIWKVNTTNRGSNLKNTFCTCKACILFKKIFSGDLLFDILRLF